MRCFTEKVFRRFPLWPQWIAAAEIGLLSLVIGIMCGWTSPYLAKLTNPDAEVPISTDEGSWVASLLNLGRVIGALSGGISQNFISSKKTLVLTAIPIILGWVLMMAARSVLWLYAARFIGGMSMGLFFACYPLFIGEISDPKIRGGLAGLIMSLKPVGNLVGNAMGPYLTLWSFAFISLIPTVMYLGLFLLLPDSPHHFVRKGDYDKASEAIRWYQREANLDSELNSLKQFIKQRESESMMDVIREMNLPQNRRAFFIVNFLFFFMQLSGIHSIYFYMEIILKNGKVTAITPATLVYMVAIVGIVSSWVELHLIDKCGRRILMALSSAGTALSLTLYACHYALLRVNYYDPETLQWLSIIASFSFQIFVCIGIAAIPSTILGELFPPNIKSTAACFISIMAGLYAFVSSKTYQPLVDLVREEFAFCLYAVLMIIQFVFCLRWMPETKGKSLQEIQDMLSNPKQQR